MGCSAACCLKSVVGDQKIFQQNALVMKDMTRHLPYIPFDSPDDSVGRLAWCKRVNGMNLECLGEARFDERIQLLT